MSTTAGLPRRESMRAGCLDGLDQKPKVCDVGSGVVRRRFEQVEQMSSSGVFERKGVGDAVDDGLGDTDGVAAQRRPISSAEPGREDKEQDSWSHADVGGRRLLSGRLSLFGGPTRD